MLRDVYFNLFTDFGFKKIFGEEPRKDLLISFLNALLPQKHQIAELHYSKNEYQGDTALDRKAIFDLNCLSSSGERFIVELQKAKQNYFKAGQSGPHGPDAGILRPTSHCPASRIFPHDRGQCSPGASARRQGPLSGGADGLSGAGRLMGGGAGGTVQNPACALRRGHSVRPPCYTCATILKRVRVIYVQNSDFGRHYRPGAG